MVRLGDPLMAHSTGRVPTLSREEEGAMGWIGDQVKLEKQQGSFSRVFIYRGLGLKLSLKHETVNEEVRVIIVKEIQAILRLYKKGNRSEKWD